MREGLPQAISDVQCLFNTSARIQPSAMSDTGPTLRFQSRDTVFLMPNTKRLLELALSGLATELNQVNQEIADLERQIRHVKGAGQSESPVTPRRSKRIRKKVHITAAGRKALSEAAKRRWVASKKAGKSTL